MDSIRGVGMMDFSGIKELTIGGVKLKELSIGGVKVWQSGRLPAGYTELEYIEATGTQYIDTGVIGRSGVSAEVSISIVSPIPSAGIGIISSTNGSQRSYVEANAASPSFKWMFGSNANYNMEAQTWEYDTQYELDIDWGATKSTMYVNNSLHMTLSHTSFNNGYSLYLLARNNSGSPTKMGKVKLYYTKIYEDGTLARDFVPAKYRDGTVGMFDLVTGRFFTNAGTGEFTAGGVVA